MINRDGKGLRGARDVFVLSLYRRISYRRRIPIYLLPSPLPSFVPIL